PGKHRGPMATPSVALRARCLAATLLAPSAALFWAGQSAKAQESEPVTLPPLHVQDSAPANPGGVDGYKSGSTRSATRTDTPLIDVPQAVSVITQDMIHDQAILSVTDAVRYVPGITVHQGESNRDQVVIRGNSTSADFFIDGARDDV